MKIAIISDIHGNLEALKATLKDIEKRKVDKIICLGDIIAKGVHPKKCISLIEPNEKYYYDTKYCKISMSCLPAWSIEQHKLVK